MKSSIVRALALLGAIIVGGATLAQAQVTRQITAKIPFSFFVGNSQYPAGTYMFRIPQGTEQSVMQMVSKSGDKTASFAITEANDKTRPQSTDLRFHHTSKGYFLTRIYQDGHKMGSKVVDDGYSNKDGVDEKGEDKDVPAQSGS